MYRKVVGDKGIRIYGDLHISDSYRGKHKDYLLLCFTVLGKIAKDIEDNRPNAVIFTGDLVGVLERNIKSREVLAKVCQYFQRLNNMTEVYVVKGNHDFGDFPEFQFLHEIGLFKTSLDCIPEGNSTDGVGYIDYFYADTDTVPCARYHLVDYGNEKVGLWYPTEDTVENIVVAHNNFTVAGQTNWYMEHDGIDLALQFNWQRVGMVIAGHIHVPSPYLVSTCIGDNEHICNLFYVGNPTMVTKDKNMYEQVWIVSFKSTEGRELQFDAVPFKLPPIEQVFYEDSFIQDMTDSEIAEVERVENLKDVVNEIINCRITTTNVEEYIKSIPNTTPEAVEIALRYYKMGIDKSVDV